MAACTARNYKMNPQLLNIRMTVLTLVDLIWFTLQISLFKKIYIYISNFFKFLFSAPVHECIQGQTNLLRGKSGVVVQCVCVLGGGGICSVHHTQRNYLVVRCHRTHTGLKFSPRSVKDSTVKLKGW